MIRTCLQQSRDWYMWGMIDSRTRDGCWDSKSKAQCLYAGASAGAEISWVGCLFCDYLWTPDLQWFGEVVRAHEGQ
jgi:hypothetical protein